MIFLGVFNTQKAWLFDIIFMCNDDFDWSTRIKFREGFKLFTGNFGKLFLD